MQQSGPSNNQGNNQGNKPKRELDVTGLTPLHRVQPVANVATWLQQLQATQSQQQATANPTSPDGAAPPPPSKKNRF